MKFKIKFNINIFLILNSLSFSLFGATPFFLVILKMVANFLDWLAVDYQNGTHSLWFFKFGQDRIDEVLQPLPLGSGHPLARTKYGLG